ncbi:HAD family hydrolase [Plantactinospora sp. KBS50]|uniref:HAD family hydrolase n=1 Tax=Plantactinospora sp. KBS50 TaxID=2024580 RepID=UPI000BAAE3E4|nr:HAD-IA family hydrolase [Plantactinospora sp. KBS50]ASW53376.1 haloacid dehalogenase [Plantactinospora sp. KBS50]
MAAFQAVLFDFFGTLTRAVQRGSRHRAVAEALGCDPASLTDVLDRSFQQRASGALGDATASLRWVGEQAGARPTDAALRTARRHRLAAVRADTRLRPEAVPVLRALRRRGVRTGLVSDCTHELPALLPSLPVTPLLDVRILSIQVGRCKPDPEMFLAACRRLAVRPADCLYVGDGGGRELTGASAVGLTAVRLAAPDLVTHLVFDADVDWRGPTVTSLEAVPGLVGSDDPAPAPAPAYAGRLTAPV